VEDAKLICNVLGIDYKLITIKPIIDEFENSLDFRPNKLTKGNMIARVRMTLIYAYANQYNLLVLGTSNRSEVLTGYYTKWGDGASDYAPLINLYKTEVWELAKRLGVPKKIIEKKPSAGLWIGQTDENELGMNYKLLDEILYRLVDLKMPKEKIAEELNVPIEKIERVEYLINRTRHERTLPTGPEFSY